MKNENITCPLCGTTKNKSLLKNHSHLRKCRPCGIVFNSGFRPQEYSGSYFLEDYRKQYGKTYLEDFDNIYNISLKRLGRINRLLSGDKDKTGLKLLDIGSALGFFLKAALDSGYGNVSGIEISEYASAQCREQFNIPVITSPFENSDLDANFDVITAWYFIEHNEDPAGAVTRIYNALNDKGIFAFSLPSIFGPQYFFSREEWAKSHPEDHRIDLSPSSVKKFLKRTGFTKVVTYPGGIHPARICPENMPGFGIFSRIYAFFSRLLCFSDTLEVYAVK